MAVLLYVEVPDLDDVVVGSTGDSCWVNVYTVHLAAVAAECVKTLLPKWEEI